MTTSGTHKSKDDDKDKGNDSSSRSGDEGSPSLNKFIPKAVEKSHNDDTVDNYRKQGCDHYGKLQHKISSHHHCVPHGQRVGVFLNIQAK